MEHATLGLVQKTPFTNKVDVNPLLDCSPSSSHLVGISSLVHHQQPHHKHGSSDDLQALECTTIVHTSTGSKEVCKPH